MSASLELTSQRNVGQVVSQCASAGNDDAGHAGFKLGAAQAPLSWEHVVEIHDLTSLQIASASCTKEAGVRRVRGGHDLDIALKQREVGDTTGDLFQVLHAEFALNGLYGLG